MKLVRFTKAFIYIYLLISKMLLPILVDPPQLAAFFTLLCQMFPVVLTIKAKVY